MKTILAFAMLMLCGTVTAMGAGPASQPSNTVYASREVRIEAPKIYLEAISNFASWLGKNSELTRANAATAPRIDIAQQRITAEGQVKLDDGDISDLLGELSSDGASGTVKKLSENNMALQALLQNRQAAMLEEQTAKEQYSALEMQIASDPTNVPQVEEEVNKDPQIINLRQMQTNYELSLGQALGGNMSPDSPMLQNIQRQKDMIDRREKMEEDKARVRYRSQVEQALKQKVRDAQARVDMMDANIKTIVGLSLPSGNVVLPVKIFVDARGNGVSAIAAETADRVLTELKLQLAKFTLEERDNWKSQIEQLNANVQTCAKHHDDIKNRLNLLKRNLADALASAGLADSSPQSVRELANVLEAQYENTGVDISGKTARQTSLAAAIAKLSDQVAATLRADPIADQLQEVVDIRQKELEDAKKGQSAAMVSDTDAGRAVAALAEAKVAVLERKEAAAHAAGADTIQKWNNDLLSLSIDLDELHARTKDLETRLQTLRQMLDLLDRKPSIQDLSKSLDDSENTLADLTQKVQTLTDNLNADQPKLTVVKSKDEPAAKN
ncbi:MAG: hypothetical protein ABSH08_11120 [Tepidisphaeraceae bacterium]|jgi:hypothetical protein